MIVLFAFHSYDNFEPLIMDAVRIIIFLKIVICICSIFKYYKKKKIKIKCLFLLPVNNARQVYDQQNWLREYGKSFFFHTEINSSNENSYFEELEAILIYCFCISMFGTILVCLQQFTMLCEINNS